MKFFFDNNISLRLVAFLADLAIEDQIVIKHLREKFIPSTPDLDWIQELSKEGEWIIITGDSRIGKNPLTKKAWQQSGLTIFFFPSSFMHQNRWEQSWRTIKIWPAIIEKAKKRPTKCAFEVTNAWHINECNL